MPPPGAEGKPAKKSPAKSSAKCANSKASPAKLASAHAHYAAGVVHELNGEPDLAMEEFLRAAQEDPEDETLTLEISRRMLLA